MNNPNSFFHAGFVATYLINIAGMFVNMIILSQFTPFWRLPAVIFTSAVGFLISATVLLTFRVITRKASRLEGGVIYGQTIFIITGFIALSLWRLGLK